MWDVGQRSVNFISSQAHLHFTCSVEGFFCVTIKLTTRFDNPFSLLFILETLFIFTFVD